MGAKSAVDLDKVNVEVLSEASEIEEEMNAENDFRLCGERIQQCLFEGEEISDQLYVDLYVAKLRITYEIKDHKNLKDSRHGSAKREMDLGKTIAALRTEIE